VPGRPFIGSEGERDSWAGKGIGRPMVGHHYWPSGSVGRANGGGERGVKGGGSAAPFSGEEGTPGWHALEAAAAAFGRLCPGEEGSRAGPTWQ
jgi:hypothetical protein